MKWQRTDQGVGTEASEPNVSDVGRKKGTAPRRAYKSRERFLRQGLEGMEEDSRRPGASQAIDRSGGSQVRTEQTGDCLGNGER